MTSSPESSTKPLSNSYLSSRRGHRALVYAMLGIAPIGFLDSTYLAIEHFLNRIPPCSVTRGCEAVVTSQYAVIWGVPLALLGSIYYLAIILALVYYLDSRRPAVIKAVAGFTVCGFLFSLYLVYLQLFVIHAICQYCMLSALSSTALFIIGLAVLKSHSNFELSNKTYETSV